MEEEWTLLKIELQVSWALIVVNDAQLSLQMVWYFWATMPFPSGFIDKRLSNTVVSGKQGECGKFKQSFAPDDT